MQRPCLFGTTVAFYYANGTTYYKFYKAKSC